MILIYKDKKYGGENAVEIVRAVERDAAGYTTRGASVQDFLTWSLEQMADLIPMRELDVSPHLSDETIAFNYLCLLESYGIAAFYETRSAVPLAGERAKIE